MSITVTLVLVVTFSVAVSTMLRRYAGDRLPISGAEYLPIGALLGVYGLDLFSGEVLTALQPFVSLLLGFVGFSLGLPLRIRLAKGVWSSAGIITAAITIFGVGGSVLAVAQLPVPGLAALGGDATWLALALGGAAAAVSVRVIDGTRARSATVGPASDLIRSIASVGNVAAVLVAGTALALERATSASNQLGMTETEWLLASGGLGLTCGLLFTFFVGRKADVGDQRVFLATVGTVIFASGMASAAGISPLLLNAISGVVVSAIFPGADRLHDKLETLERPAVATLMIFAGAMWRPAAGALWLLPIVYLVTRAVAQRAGAALAVRTVPGIRTAQRPGGGLVAQGGIAVAVAVNYAQVHPGLASAALTAVLLPLLVLDPLAPRWIRRFFADAGEIGRARQATP